jgi:hypothetical protein
MAERCVGFVIVGEVVTVVDVELPDSLDEPLTIVADDTWKLQAGERAEAYTVLHQRCADYLRENRVGSVVCGATIKMRTRIASPENVPDPSSFASPNLLLLPHHALLESELLFPLFDISCLLLWALWGCGRRARVVQAQRQIHRALGKAGVIKPSTPRAGRLVIHSGAGVSSGHVCGSL